MYMCVCIHVCVYTYIYIYIHIHIHNIQALALLASMPERHLAPSLVAYNAAVNQATTHCTKTMIEQVVMH